MPSKILCTKSLHFNFVLFLKEKNLSKITLNNVGLEFHISFFFIGIYRQNILLCPVNVQGRYQDHISVAPAVFSVPAEQILPAMSRGSYTALSKMTVCCNPKYSQYFFFVASASICCKWECAVLIKQAFMIIAIKQQYFAVLR